MLYADGRGYYSDHDILYGKPTENFNISFGKRKRNWSFGFNFDYSKFNFYGNGKRVGYIQQNGSYGMYNKQINYFIKQNVQYSNVSIGTSVLYSYAIKKIIFDFGSNLNFIIIRTPLIISNTYDGEQTNYNMPLPLENKYFEEQQSSDELINRIPYFGANLNVGYKLNSKITIKFSNAICYDFAVRIIGTPHTGVGLPTQCIYRIDRQLWISSGLSLMFNF